ncbi:glycoside hydrolase family 78 protein [Candidatus Latescibacterota bacterium]
MRRLLAILVIITIATGMGCSQKRGADMTINNLRCEYLTNPLGIDITLPRLSWVLESDTRGQYQTAYRIVVASSEENLKNNVGDLWDTGKVISNKTNQIEYDGRKLASRMQCFWKVCVWDRDDVITDFSEPSFWTMGLLEEDDWKSSWIAMDNKGLPETPKEFEPGPPPPWFRKTFSLSKEIGQALVYITSRGLFELQINGDRVGKDIFAPGWTDYRQRIHYRTYDVTSMLRKGENAIGAIVGDGWFSGYIGWLNMRGFYGLQNSLLLQVEIEYADGTTEIIATDESWKCSDGPILNSDFMMGENYDARKEMPGWNTTNFDDSLWNRVSAIEKPSAILTAQPSQPVQVTEYVESKRINEPAPGVFVFDLGQNIVGWARLMVKGSAGTKVTMRFAERLNPDGTIYTENLRTAKATDTYILSGKGEEVYEPHFTFHGFQYVEVTGFPGELSTDAITGCVVHSNTPPTGVFECSDPMVNKLWLNTMWGQRGNFISIPTDCPQRNERLGWMGDAQVFIRTAAFNMDVAAFFTKWMIDVEDAQSHAGSFSDISPMLGRTSDDYAGAPAWGDAGVIVPWTIYRVYGDTRIIEKHYDAMVRWMDFIHEGNPELIRRNRLGSNYGDWLSIDADTPKEMLATAYWAYDVSLMSKMAEAIGRDNDAKKYEKLFMDIRSVFQKNFVTPDGRVYPLKGVKEKTGQIPVGHTYVAGRGETQAGYLLALKMDLLPEELRAQAAEYLVEDIRNRNWHLSTGFVGVSYLNPVLSSTGHNDVAYCLLMNDTFPSWLYPIKNGATTIWERWDGWTEEKGFQDPGMNSFNHYSLGSVGEWLYRFVAGIELDPDVPGFRHFIIHPYPGNELTNARAEYISINGKIASQWEKENGKFYLTITIPANTTAKVYIPSDEGTPITESDKTFEEVESAAFAGYENGCAVISLGSGTYHFASTLPN